MRNGKVDCSKSGALNKLCAGESCTLKTLRAKIVARWTVVRLKNSALGKLRASTLRKPSCALNSCALKVVRRQSCAQEKLRAGKLRAEKLHAKKLRVGKVARQKVPRKTNVVRLALTCYKAARYKIREPGNVR